MNAWRHKFQGIVRGAGLLVFFMTIKAGYGSVSPEPDSTTEPPMSMQEPNTVSGAQHPKAANALIHESSPYLLQHAYNPVAWYPWGEEAFARARREDKPVFLSIGYSTCYWCHVMEKQSFENESVARVLNAHYIAIKVDREERPDIDEQFMLVTQLMTGRGGWPNSLWLTPEGKPWMAGTYFPRPQFIDILHQLASVWDQQRDRVLEQAAQLTEAIRQSGSGDPLHAPREDRAPSREWERRAIENYRESYDPRYGGFGQAPKFPPHGALRVLNHALRTLDDQELRDIYFSTLNAMWVGGFHDHLGGGFHRYSTDARWLLPHFEKMLYDNAQLMQAFTQGYLLSGNPLYREAVVDIFNWLTREMTSPEGGFYSALDSGEVGREGEYYVWSYQEVLEVLGTEDGAWFASIYNIMPDGNFHEEATGKPSGKNIPHLVQLPADLARETGEDPREFGTRIRALSSRLLEHQRTREQPHRDDKILTSWNGLMIGALAEAGQFLNEKKYLEAAVHAAAFIVTNMKNDDDRLLRSYRAGRAHLAAYLDDMAYLADGLLALYRATGEKKWLDEAVGLAEVMLDEFQDSESGAFFFTSSKTHDRMLVRSKNSSGGGNEPDESGVAAHLLLELFVETGRVEFLNASKRTMRALSGVISQHPRALESGVYAAMVYLDHEESARVAGPVMARTKVTGEPVLPGQAFQIAVILDIEKGWHLYGENPGLDFLVPARVESEPHDGVKVKVIHATEPIQKIDPVIQKTVATYEGRVEFHFEGTVNPGACDQEIPLTFAITTQPCDATRCLPPRTDTLTVPIKIRPAD